MFDLSLKPSWLFSVFILPVLAAGSIALGGQPPPVGTKAADFQLANADGMPVRLSEMTGIGNGVALVVLRGFPGYQCPFCNRQFQDFAKRSADFASKGVKVVFIYPGPANKAGEFLSGKTLPEGFQMLIDPDYYFTNLYGLRWDQPNETAYPSVFLIDNKGDVYFSRIAKTHGGRVSAQETIDLIPKTSPARR